MDIIGKIRHLGSIYYHSIEGYFDAAIIFIVLSIVIEKAFTLLDKKLSHSYEDDVESISIPVGALDENDLVVETVKTYSATHREHKSATARQATNETTQCSLYTKEILGGDFI
jgi:hypothetical protein